MPRFQTAVLNKYLKQQDGARMATAYAAFRAHFHKVDQTVRPACRQAGDQKIRKLECA